MTQEVKGVLGEWFTGLLIGAIPLFAHICAYITMKPADSNHVVGGWSMDILFVGITLASSSIVSVVRKAPAQITRGRAVPTLTVCALIFLIVASILYAGVVTGHARTESVPLSIGLTLGAGAVSMYLELSVAARIAGEPAPAAAVSHKV